MHTSYTLLLYKPRKKVEIKNVNNVKKKILQDSKKNTSYFQTTLKTPVKFPKDRPKTVGGVTRKRCIPPIHFGGISLAKG